MGAHQKRCNDRHARQGLPVGRGQESPCLEHCLRGARRLEEWRGNWGAGRGVGMGGCGLAHVAGQTSGSWCDHSAAEGQISDARLGSCACHL